MKHAYVKAHAKRAPRQTRARATIYLLAGFALAVMVGLAVFQVLHYGWESFILRPPGIGATPLPGDD